MNGEQSSKPNTQINPARVAGDDGEARSLNVDYLQTEEWMVHPARSGLGGLKACEQNTPGLIILDLKMPEMDGRAREYSRISSLIWIEGNRKTNHATHCTRGR